MPACNTFTHFCLFAFNNLAILLNLYAIESFALNLLYVESFVADLLRYLLLLPAYIFVHERRLSLHVHRFCGAFVHVTRRTRWMLLYTLRYAHRAPRVVHCQLLHARAHRGARCTCSAATYQVDGRTTCHVHRYRPVHALILDSRLFHVTVAVATFTRYHHVTVTFTAAHALAAALRVIPILLRCWCCSAGTSCVLLVPRVVHAGRS